MTVTLDHMTFREEKLRSTLHPTGVCIYSRHLETEQKLEMKSDTDQGQHLAFRYYEFLKFKDA